MKKKEIISRSDIVWGISMVLNNWYYIVAIPFLIWAGVYLYAYKQQDISAASCQIMLKDESSFQSQFQEQFKKVSATFSYEYTAGQMRVIKSSDLIEKVLQELQLDVRYFIVGRLKVVELYHHVPFKVTFDKRATDVFYKEFGLEVIDEESKDRFIPHVLELSFGLGRNLYSSLDQHLVNDKENRGNLLLNIPNKLNLLFLVCNR